MFPMRSCAFIFYGDPSPDYLGVFSESVTHLHPADRAPTERSPDLLCVVHDLFHETLPPFSFFESLSPARMMLLPAVPCRETLREVLNIVRRLEGMPLLEAGVSRENLAAAMRGYVGVASSALDPPALPVFLASELDLLYPYPPLLRDDLEVDRSPELFLVHAGSSLAEGDTYSPGDAYPDKKSALTVVAPPSTPGALLYLLSRLNPGARVTLHAAFGGQGAVETEDLYLYRKHESELVDALRLIHENSLDLYGVRHTPDPYLARCQHWRPSTHLFRVWFADLFRTKPIVSLREVEHFADLFDLEPEGMDLDEIEAVDYYGRKGGVVCRRNLFIFSP